MDTEARRKSLLALSERQGHYGSIDVVDVLAIMELRDEKIKELSEGYRKLPKDKPPLICADGCATNLGIIGAICNCGAQAQREADIKHYETLLSG